MQIFTRYLISTRPRRKANCTHGMCLERYQITLAHWTTPNNFLLPLMWKMHKRKFTWNRCGHFKQESHKKSGCFRGKHLVPSPSFFAGRLVHVFIMDLDFMPSENLFMSFGRRNDKIPIMNDDPRWTELPRTTKKPPDSSKELILKTT